MIETAIIKIKCSAEQSAGFVQPNAGGIMAHKNVKTAAKTPQTSVAR